MCGPGELIDNVNQFLKDLGTESDKIHYERFTSGNTVKLAPEVLRGPFNALPTPLPAELYVPEAYPISR